MPRKRGCQFSSKKSIFQKKEKKKKNESVEFCEDRRQSLAESDLGSYFNQEQLVIEETEEPSTSASSRKLSSTGQSLLSNSTSEDYQTPGDLTIVDMQILNENIMASLRCKHCGGEVRLLENTASRQGLGTTWRFECENHCLLTVFPTTRRQDRIFEINRATTLAMRCIGRGHSSAEKMFSIIGLPPPVSHKPWSDHCKLIEEETKQTCEENMIQAALEVKTELQKEGLLDGSSTVEQLKEEIVDTGVSLDGSWCSRGWSATDCCVAAISVKTGKVLDVVHLSKSCAQCSKMESLREKGEVNKLAYLKWYIDHEPTCFLNHEGSSSAMEATGVLQLYKRSVEKRKIRYIPFVGDGDSKSYSNVCKAQPYGPAVFIPKEECIGHVTKKMGTALRGLVTEWKGKKLKDGKGLSGVGRLTMKRIDTLQNFYGRVIRDNQGDAEAMAKGTRAILQHYSSTPEVPQHDDCPAGADSWCSYQRDKANNTRLHKPIKNPFAPAVIELVQPIFARLGSKEFLVGCEKGLTQNANECLHHVIWSMAPKGCSNSPQEISTAIHLGVLFFNSGMDNTLSILLQKCKVHVKPEMRMKWNKIDMERVYLSDYRATETVKKRRKSKRRKKLQKLDAFVHQEGTTYKSQSFHGGSCTTTTKRKSTKKSTKGKKKQKS